MANGSKADVSGKSPEEIAYQLFQHIVDAEEKRFHPSSARSDQEVANRDWILATFAQCMQVVRNPTQYVPEHFAGKLKKVTTKSANRA